MEWHPNDNPEENNLTDREVFTKIWSEPRRVFKFIDQSGYGKYGFYLLCLVGIARAFDKAIEKNWGDDMSLWAVLATCIFVGGLFGWISLYIYSFFISWSGNWLKGEANSDTILRIMTYSAIPTVAAMVLLVYQISFFGNEVFQEQNEIENTSIVSYPLFLSLSILRFAFGIWSFVLLVIGVSEVQKFTVGKALLNVLLPFLVLLVPILIVVFVFV